MPRDDLIQVRRGTAAEWASADPVLAAGEPGWDTTNDVFKIGDGTTVWSALSEPGSGTSPTVKWLALTRFETIAGAPARSDVNDWPGWSFANGANGVVATTISGLDMDEWGLDWATFDIEFWWINAGAGAGNVRMYDYAADVVADGGTASLGSLGGSTVAAPAQNVVEVTIVKSGITVPTTAQIQRIAVGRNGASGADTLANAVLGVGVMLRKAS